MTLTRALSNAHSGLTAASFRADIASSNISNALTPGYVRRDVVTTERTVAGTGNGVNISHISRAQELSLTRARRDADGALSQSSVLADSYNALTQKMGLPGDPYGLFNAVDSVEASLRDLQATPESDAYQFAAFTALQDLVGEFNALSQFASEMRSGADRDIARDVTIVNNALYRIQELNGDIGGMNEGSGEAAALEDQRQQLIDTIAEIIPIRDIQRDDGQVEILTESGVFLLAGSVYEVEFTAAGVIPDGHRYGETPAYLSGLFVGDQEITPGSGSVHSIDGGRLGGLFMVRDQVAPDFSDALDALAGDLISRFEIDAIDPTTPAGAPGLLTDNGIAFDASNIRGLAGRISINNAVDPDAGGSLWRLRDGLGAVAPGAASDASIITGLLNAMTDRGPSPSGLPVTGQHSSTELVASFASIIGNQSIRQDAIYTGNLARQTQLADAELSQIAVDTDLELQKLIMIEQSYAANARVIQTVSDMLDQLLRL